MLRAAQPVLAVDFTRLRVHSTSLPCLFSPAGTSWHTVDQYGINWGHEHLYADNVHFPGVLSDVTWNIVMSKLCPLNGTDSGASSAVMA